MFVIEVTEDKYKNLVEHMKKGIHCFSKVMDCLEEMKEYEVDDEADVDEEYETRSRLAHYPRSARRRYRY